MLFLENDSIVSKEKNGEKENINNIIMFQVEIEYNMKIIFFRLITVLIEMK